MNYIVEYYEKKDDREIMKYIRYFLKNTNEYDPILYNVSIQKKTEWLETIHFLTEEVYFDELDILNDKYREKIVSKFDSLQFRYQKYKLEEYHRIKKEFIEEVKKFYSEYSVIILFPKTEFIVSDQLLDEKMEYCKKSILSAVVKESKNKKEYIIVDIIYNHISIVNKIGLKVIKDKCTQYIFSQNHYHFFIFPLIEWGIYQNYDESEESMNDSFYKNFLIHEHIVIL